MQTIDGMDIMNKTTWKLDNGAIAFYSGKIAKITADSVIIDISYDDKTKGTVEWKDIYIDLSLHYKFYTLSKVQEKIRRINTYFNIPAVKEAAPNKAAPKVGEVEDIHHWRNCLYNLLKNGITPKKGGDERKRDSSRKREFDVVDVRSSPEKAATKKSKRVSDVPEDILQQGLEFAREKWPSNPIYSRADGEEVLYCENLENMKVVLEIKSMRRLLPTSWLNNDVSTYHSFYQAFSWICLTEVYTHVYTNRLWMLVSQSC
jgi:hypothetical protein